MKAKTWTVVLVWSLGLVLVWEAVAYLLAVGFRDPMAGSKLPFLHDILITLARNWGSLLNAASVTYAEAALGFALGASVGYALAVVMSVSRTAERIAFPYLIISQMIPVLGLAPIIFNIVRNMSASRIVIAAYITFFPVAVNTLSGFRSVDREKRELMQSYAANRRTSYFKLMMPFSVPYLFAGLKIAGPLSVTASILVDMLGSRDGIGVKLLYALYGGAMDIFWASVLVSALMGILSYLLIVVAERILVPWQGLRQFNSGMTQ